mmetsp:Transcript_3152/g.5661  ORF Transcript_3152/g.5661 Transcript_3152/m.5661 type:complete len:203 (+) Transcript_3152:819-1427(+)
MAYRYTNFTERLAASNAPLLPSFFSKSARPCDAISNGDTLPRACLWCSSVCFVHFEDTIISRRTFLFILIFVAHSGVNNSESVTPGSPAPWLDFTPNAIISCYARPAFAKGFVSTPLVAFPFCSIPILHLEYSLFAVPTTTFFPVGRAPTREGSGTNFSPSCPSGQRSPLLSANLCSLSLVVSRFFSLVAVFACCSFRCAAQ